MKFLFALFSFLFMAFLVPGLSAREWLTDIEKAKAESQKTGLPIYILFTNTDISKCRQYDLKLFNQKKFKDYADNNLVLVKADFGYAFSRQQLPKKLADLANKLKVDRLMLPRAFLLDFTGEEIIDYINKTNEAARQDTKKRDYESEMNYVLDFDSVKRYREYLDPFVQESKMKIAEEKKRVAEEKKKAAEEKKKAAEEKKKAAEEKKKNETAVSKETAATTPEASPNEAKSTVPATTIPDENGGTLLIPLDPKGNLEDWLKANGAEEAAEKAAEIEDAKETVEEEKNEIEAQDKAAEEAKSQPQEDKKTDTEAASQPQEDKN